MGRPLKGWVCAAVVMEVRVDQSASLEERNYQLRLGIPDGVMNAGEILQKQYHKTVASQKKKLVKFWPVIIRGGSKLFDAFKNRLTRESQK